MTPFDTANLVAALDTSIFNVTCALEVGRDFLSDAAVNIGTILTEAIGQRLAQELDKVISVGNGSVQPEGITVASGTTSVPKAGGNGSAWTVADLENLLFSVAKQYRNAALQPCFIANDTTYSRLMGIPVSTTDQRRVFWFDQSTANHNGYNLLGWPVRVCNALPNATLVFGCLKKYRLYRRQGLAIEWSREGRTLMLANLSLLVARGRFGGRVVDPAAFALITTGQS